LEHFKEYDFIWSSPPCPTHSDIRRCSVHSGKVDAKYPDMKLYEEIILLKHFALKNTKWVVENVIGYYEPLIPPFIVNKHYWWSNFLIREIPKETRGHTLYWKDIGKLKGIDIEKYEGIDKRKALRNCVEPETGLHVFNEAFKQTQQSLI
jgi:DNA (cytosine-5)-methyltransferase 1